ncbi:MAG: hypothetical protein Q9217_005269, partial [Psora testacea]
MTFDLYQSSDKDSGYATQTEDMCKDLFDLDEGLSRHSSQSIIDPAGHDGFGAFDFNFNFDGDTTTIGNNSANSFSASNTCLERPLSTSNCSAPPIKSSGLRPHRVLPRSSQLSLSISGSELLSIEGKLHSNERVPSLPHVSRTPTLHRKGKFCGPKETVRPKPQQTSKPSPNDIIRQPYYYKHEMPSYQEWTQRFGQISLQQPDAVQGLCSSPTPRLIQSEELRPPHLQYQPSTIRHRKTVSEQLIPQRPMQAQHVTSDSPLIPRGSPQGFTAQPHVQAGALCDSYHSCDSIGAQANGAPRHIRQPASWSQSLANFHCHDYTVSPSQLHTNWEPTLQENTDSYFGNAAQAAAMPHDSTPDFSIDYIGNRQLGPQASDHPQVGGMQQSQPINPENYLANSYNNSGQNYM